MTRATTTTPTASTLAATTIDRMPTGTPLREDGPVRDIVAFFAIGYAIAWTTWLVIAWAAADAGVDSDTFIRLVEAGELGDLQTALPGWVLYLLSRVIDSRSPSPA